jgi:hypothetical protein
MNIGKIIKHLRKPSSLLYIAFTVFSVVICGSCHSTTPESLQATKDVEASLTEIHGARVSDAIENFEMRWSSLNAHKNPDIQSEIATGSFLDYFGYARQGSALFDEPFWLIVKSATVESVRVLDYSPEHFKAVACVTELIDETDTQGVFKEALPPREFRGIYVFVHENDTWKLSGFFDITHPKDSARDWDYASDWLKEIIGDMPEWEPCSK